MPLPVPAPALTTINWPALERLPISMASPPEQLLPPLASSPTTLILPALRRFSPPSQEPPPSSLPIFPRERFNRSFCRNPATLLPASSAPWRSSLRLFVEESPNAPVVNEIGLHGPARIIRRRA